MRVVQTAGLHVEYDEGVTLGPVARHRVLCAEHLQDRTVGEDKPELDVIQHILELPMKTPARPLFCSSTTHLGGGDVEVPGGGGHGGEQLLGGVRPRHQQPRQLHRQPHRAQLRVVRTADQLSR